MSMFKKEGKKEVPAMETASISDIVFMFLFFFMVTTQLRSTENKVQVRIPFASESVKLERKDLSSYIHVGTPIRSLQAQYGNETRIQLNDSFRTTKDIRDFVAAERESMSEADRAFMTVCIRADQNTRMGIITDIKQELRRCSALKIMYTASRAGQE
ncbi:MAG: biopolymer transporter ExbD [Candidatus Cryptobacteroides sp.]|jgi:biopolymer transport protein ExbD